MFRRLLGLLITFFITGCLIVYKPKLDFSSVANSKGLYDLNMSEVVSTEKDIPDFDVFGSDEGEDTDLIDKVLEVQQAGGIAQYAAAGATDTINDTLDGFMGDMSSVMDSELYQ